MAKRVYPLETLRRQYTCLTCGKKQLRLPSAASKRFFCCHPCYAKSLQGKSPHNKGKITYITKVCHVCCKEFSGKASEIKNKLCCSRHCAGLASHRLNGDIGEYLLSRSIPEPNSGCWLWLGSLTKGGYARIRNKLGVFTGAHRVSYEHFVGLIPPGLQIDHLCKVRCCINPDHLEPVTLQENIRRGDVGKGPRSELHRKSIKAGLIKAWADPNDIRRDKAREKTKEIWAMRRKGILPMPDHGRGKS